MLSLGLNMAAGSVMQSAGLLLDEFGSAAVAYSLRKLRAGYTGKVLQLRRESDHVEVDVSFDASGFLSLDSTVTNVTEESTGMGGATVGTTTEATKLGQFVGDAGYDRVDSMTEAAHVAVVTWYDQSGNGNDATNLAVPGQPRIYDRTAGLVTKNGKPGVVGSSSQSRLSTSSVMTLGDFCVSMVYEENTGNLMTWGHNTSVYQYHTGSGGRVNGMLSYTSNISNGDQGHYFLNKAGTGVELHMNGSSLATDTHGAAYYFQDIFNAHSNFFGYTEPIQEFVLWQSDQSGGQTGIESNINTFYSIY